MHKTYLSIIVVLIVIAAGVCAFKWDVSTSRADTLESDKIRFFDSPHGTEILHAQCIGLEISWIAMQLDKTSTALPLNIKGTEALIVRSADHVVYETYITASTAHQPVMFVDYPRNALFMAFREVSGVDTTAFRCVVIKSDGTVLSEKSVKVPNKYDQALINILMGTDGRPVLMVGGWNAVQTKSGNVLHAELSTNYVWTGGAFELLE